MSDERRDDEILGRALGRAIETIEVNETPFAQARIATMGERRGVVTSRLVGAMAFALVALVLGLSVNALRESRDVPAVASTAPSISRTAPAASASVAPSQPLWVYFARDGLPPVGANVDAVRTGAEREAGITTRLSTLMSLQPTRVPAGASNPLGSVSPAVNGSRQTGLGVHTSGDTAYVEFNLPTGWGVSGSTQSQALLQQIVYTVTEEPGIDSVVITERGKSNAVIDQVVVDKPLSREDVSGYSRVSPQLIGETWPLTCTTPCPSPSTAKLSNTFFVDKVPVSAGAMRFMILVESGQPSEFYVSPLKNDQTRSQLPGKSVLQIDIAGTDSKTGTELVNSSPLRAIRTAVRGARTVYELALDDLRPWRVAILPNPERIVIDLGGYPASVSDTIAVYSPGQGDPPLPRFSVTGLARTFEAAVLWRVRDGQNRIVAKGSTTASLGTSQQWGTFQFEVQLPAPPPGTGDLFLEVYWASPKDGSDQGLVRVHLKVG